MSNAISLMIFFLQYLPPDFSTSILIEVSTIKSAFSFLHCLVFVAPLYSNFFVVFGLDKTLLLVFLRASTTMTISTKFSPPVPNKEVYQGQLLWLWRFQKTPLCLHRQMVNCAELLSYLGPLKPLHLSFLY